MNTNAHEWRKDWLKRKFSQELTPKAFTHHGGQAEQAAATEI
jgi:hypothetical protein